MPELPRLFDVGTAERPKAEHLASFMKALADPSRVQLLALLLQRDDQTVTQLLVAHGLLSQPTVSHHLRILTEAGLVVHRRDGRYIRYTASHGACRQMSDAIRPGRGGAA